MHHRRQLEQEEREKNAKLKKANVFDPAMSHCTTYHGATIYTIFCRNPDPVPES